MSDEAAARAMQEAAIKDLLDRYTDAQHAMQDGCSDGYCVVRKPRGMHTNGGCRCLYHPDLLTTQRAGHIMRLAQDMEITILALLDALDAGAAREASLGAENDRLREALKPFAKAGSLFSQDIKEGISDQCIYAPAAGREYNLSGNDLRLARAAIAQGDR